MADDVPDTLAMAKQLESAGIPPALATAHAQVIANAILAERQFSLAQLCTKADLKAELALFEERLEQRLEKRLEERLEKRLEERMSTMINRCKVEIINWVVSLLLVQTAITSGLILKLLP